jgi:hypothetical protein
MSSPNVLEEILNYKKDIEKYKDVSYLLIFILYKNKNIKTNWKLRSYSKRYRSK